MQFIKSSLIVIPVAFTLAAGCAASRADRAARLEDANDRQEDRLDRREERLEERQEALDAHDGKNDPDRP